MYCIYLEVGALRGVGELGREREREREGRGGEIFELMIRYNCTSKMNTTAKH